MIEALAAGGLHLIPEAGRAIIQNQNAIGGSTLPWADRLAFAELMLSWELRSYREAQARSGPVVFDRGVPDVAGYLRLEGLPVPEHVLNAARIFRYHQQVFIAPPWPEIFTEDTEHKQSLETAERTYRAMAEVYTELGYEPLPLPLAPVAERVRFARAVIR